MSTDERIAAYAARVAAELPAPTAEQAVSLWSLLRLGEQADKRAA